ncbi:MAG TPA: YggS family pyridoxal phosphate-dependent enzyme [Solirubrobacteraceae bacterium]|nr:YggS family pyridoxal phosphate-dependent enzyme [Solirubrobacteraceae bacterium]
MHDLRAERVRANLEAVRGEIAKAARKAGRDPEAVELLAACKYVPLEELPALAQAGVLHLGENRAQELVRKASAPGSERFSWDFIGALQSKHIRAIVPHVRLIHSLASESALHELARVADRARPGMRVLIEVNVAGDGSKGGIAAEELSDYLASSPFPVAGLMTMPPLTDDPLQSRPYFRALRELAERHGLGELSMGTSQDFAVAVEEGATIVRIGTRLYE